MTADDLGAPIGCHGCQSIGTCDRECMQQIAIDERTLLTICAQVPCRMRELRAYLSTTRPVSLTLAHHVHRVLVDMGISDPRAVSNGSEP